MSKKMMRYMSIFLAVILLTVSVVGCGSGDGGEKNKELTREEATAELTSLLKKVSVDTIPNPTLDIYGEDASEADSLADIDTFPITVEGNGEINIEIATATEMSSKAPDDWLNIVAKNFNKAGKTINGKKVSVSIRKMASGEVLTYVRAGAYKPNVYIPSNDAWGKMLKSSGVGLKKIEERLAGNTAGILMQNDVYDTFIEKYKEPSMQNILSAANAGDIIFAYTNPYTSSTGLNILTAMLASFDKDNPLSTKASEQLLAYQKTSPPVAYTTGVLRDQAAKGIINTMVMEEQAYINSPELKDYVYIPAGIRHDHPVYIFDYDNENEKKAAQMFVDYCLEDDNQDLATEKGFNHHNDYVPQDPGLDGTGYLNAQSVWKKNKNGGRPIVAVFIADISGSMSGEPLNSVKDSLIKTSSYIGSDNYVGFVSYSDDVTINLPIEQFDAKQRAYFTGEVKKLSAAGATATYDAVLVALGMLQEKEKEIPDAQLMLFVLSDGEQNEGYSLKRIKPIVAGLKVPVYTIAYNYSDENDELEQLAKINEAAALKSTTDDIINQLRNLFNVQM